MSTAAIQLCMTHSMAGGLRELLSDLAEGLGERGHPVRCFVLYPPQEAATQAIDRDEWLHLTEHRPASPAALWRLWRALLAHLRATRPAAIVTTTPVVNVLVPLAVAWLRLPTRVFVSHHSPVQTHHWLLNWLDSWTGKLRCVAAIVSVSQAVSESLADKPATYREKRRTITNALPRRIERLIDEIRRPPRDSVEPRARAIALGRLTRQKNYPLLLQAMAAAPSVEVDIVGNGEDEAMLRILTQELGIGDRVRFVGLRPRAAALRMAAEADMFVQLSLYEGHSLALIEAARLGLPTVISDVPVQVEGASGPDDMLAAVAVPLDAPEIAGAVLERLAGDAAERRRLSAAMRRVGEAASNDAMLDAYEALVAPSAAR